MHCLTESQPEKAMSYFFMKTTDYSFEDALAKSTEALKSQGFGVLTEIDVKATLKKKLDQDFRKYKILGACNPPFAHRALQLDGQIGLMLPCNVVVQEQEDGKVAVSAIDPVAAMAAVENPQLADLAKEVRARLMRVIELV
jgi:uncharacterized protein (DUF302 family)